LGGANDSLEPCCEHCETIMLRRASRPLHIFFGERRFFECPLCGIGLIARIETTKIKSASFAPMIGIVAVVLVAVTMVLAGCQSTPTRHRLPRFPHSDVISAMTVGDGWAMPLSTTRSWTGMASGWSSGWAPTIMVQSDPATHDLALSLNRHCGSFLGESLINDSRS